MQLENLGSINADAWVGGVAVWLGAVFVSAGGLKLARPDGVRAVLVRSFGLRRKTAIWLASALGVVEAVLGCLLAIGAWPLFTAGLLCLLLFGFTGFLVRGASKGESACGCFGLLDTDSNNRFLGVARNLVLMAAAAVVAFAADPVLESGFMKWSASSALLGVYLLVVSAVMYIVLRQLAEPLHK